MHDTTPNGASTFSVLEGSATTAAAGATPDLSRPMIAMTDIVAGTAARSGALVVPAGAQLQVAQVIGAKPETTFERAAHPELDLIVGGAEARWLSPAAASALRLGAHVLVVPILQSGSPVGAALLGYDEPIAFSSADRAFLVRAFALRTSSLSVAAA